MDLFAEIGSGSPKARDGFAGAGLTTLTNCIGGVIAGRVRDIIRDQFKQYPSSGDIGVFAIATGLRVYCSSGSSTDAVLRELAGGMGGAIGDDMWTILKGWIGIGVKTWEVGKTYTKGTEVRYGSQVYQAAEDVPASGGAPDSDKKWRLLRAQGMDSQQLGQVAMKMMQDDRLWSALQSDFAQALDARMGSIAGQANFEIPPEFYQSMFREARGALNDIASKVMQG
jgi:hypothetical protein